MAAFRQHIAFSSLLGVGYGAALIGMGWDWVQSALAGLLCGFSGMLPDLDSPSGKPVREVFGLAAIIVPLLLANRLQSAGLTPEQVVLSAAGMYLFIRFGMAWVLGKISVHRGMFHSLPAALIAGEIVFLAHSALPAAAEVPFPGRRRRVGLSVASSAGRNLQRGRQRPGAAFEGIGRSAVKLFSSSIMASLLTWIVLGMLSYEAGVEQGYLKPIQVPQQLQELDRFLPRGHAASDNVKTSPRP